MDALDPVDDYLTLCGQLLPGVTLKTYDPTKDVDDADPWSDAVKIRGSRGPKRTTGSSGAGDIATTHVTWTITSVTADVELARPNLRSKILQGGETWVILDIEPDSIDGRLYECFTQLSPGG